MALMKRIAKWLGVLLLTPILLFLLLAALLYCPPVQNWAVRQVARVASEQLGMDISVGHVNLEWPLDLGIDHFLMVHNGDTIANVSHLSAGIGLRPLLSKRVVVKELELTDAQLNTNGFISDVQVSGRVGRLSARSRGIDLSRQTVEVNGAMLADARLNIVLADTAATDTTASDISWRINADSIAIYRTAVGLTLPGDSIHISTYLGHTVARNADIDLDTKTYSVDSFDWHDGRLTYDTGAATMPTAGSSNGLNVDHLSVSAITLGIDSIYYGPLGTRFTVRQAAMREQCGLEITSLSSTVRLDTAFTHIELPQLSLRTTDSAVDAVADIDFNVAETINPGKMHLRLNAQIGKQDLRLIGSGLASNGSLTKGTFWKETPNHPITIIGSADGNLERMELTGVHISLPTAFQASINGFAANLRDISRLRAQVAMDVKTQDLSFITALLPADMARNYRLPRNMTMKGSVTADTRRYTADLSGNIGKGTLRLKGSYNDMTQAYDATIHVGAVNLHELMPRDSLYTLSGDIKLKGRGTDLLSPATTTEAQLTIAQLKYGQWNIDDVNATATLKNGLMAATLTGHNALLNGTIGLDGRVSKTNIDATVSTDIAALDLQHLRLSEKPLTIGMSGSIDVRSDLKSSHEAKGRIGGIYIKDRLNTYRPEDVGVLLRTNSDTTLVRLQSGNLIIKADASGGYEPLLKRLTALKDSVIAQYEDKVIDQAVIKQMLPTGRIYLSSGQTNPMAYILHTKGIDYKEILLDISMSPEKGINGESHLYSLSYDSTCIDTIALQLKQKGDRLTYSGQVTNNRKNPQFVFNALFDGHIHQHGALVGLRYFDENGRMGVRLGATAGMETNGIRLRLMPEQPTIGYKVFNLNADNYIFIGSDNRLEAKVDLIADDKTGVKIYTSNPIGDDEDMTARKPSIDLTVSLNRFNLDELTSVLPYMPRMTGLMGGDFHIVQDNEGRFSIVSDMAIDKMSYEGSTIGNIDAELTYLQRENGSHAIEARLMLDDEEFGLLSGTYTHQTSDIDAMLTLTRTPLSIVNGFVPDQIVGLDGYAEGELSIKGKLSQPLVDGEIYLDSAYLVSQPYGVRMRFDNDPMRIVGSHLLVENFGLYAHNEQPLTLMGDIDFSNTERIAINMRMRAQNYQIINAKQTAKSVIFGKAFINLYAQMQGPVDAMKMRGRLDLLSSTDMTYMLLDSPLSTDNRLDELVKFTDFNDTTQTVITRPAPSGIEADLTVNVAQGARVLCNLNTEQTNYVDITGRGDLRLRYNTDGLTLTGRYTVANGEMKYSLPIIPLKTFNIKEGSYVDFAGDPTNPRLNITATERKKATVGGDGEPTRTGSFECGVVITKTLKDLGLQFIIEAPEDNAVNGDLQSMSAEERGKIAVAMLTTGMYLADGNTRGFSMNSALSSFLQSEINMISGSALQTLDLQVGIDNTTDASGQMHTDYSFRFAKRFMNNRLKIQIGGKVSSGTSNAPGEQQSFFDNVTMEYRLDDAGQQSIKLYYQQNVYDWLEGYTGLYGGGFVWRRKVSTLRDLLLFWKKDNTTPTPSMRRRESGEDAETKEKSEVKSEE